MGWKWPVDFVCLLFGFLAFDYCSCFLGGFLFVCLDSCFVAECLYVCTYRFLIYVRFYIYLLGILSLFICYSPNLFVVIICFGNVCLEMGIRARFQTFVPNIITY